MMENKLVTVVAAIAVIVINRLVGEFGGAELLDGETIQWLAGVVSAYLVSRGIADHGK
jgi:hypothetical protein